MGVGGESEGGVDVMVCKCGGVCGWCGGMVCKCGSVWVV